MAQKSKPQLGEVKPGYKWRDFFETNYLASWDLEGDTTVTIVRAMYEEVTGEKGRKDKCLVLYFKDYENGMIVNVTNSKTIQRIHSEKEPAKWIGKKITLFVDPNVTIKGEKVGGIRIRPVVPKKNALPAARFEKMVSAIKSGSYDKLQALQSFDLTKEQHATISAL